MVALNGRHLADLPAEFVVASQDWVCDVRPGNDASIAVCRRLGMARLGRIRRWYDVELEAFRLIAPAVVD